jgi:hypothetical protein
MCSLIELSSEGKASEGGGERWGWGSEGFMLLLFIGSGSLAGNINLALFILGGCYSLVIYNTWQFVSTDFASEVIGRRFFTAVRFVVLERQLSIEVTYTERRHSCP